MRFNGHPKRIILVDHHNLVRDGIALLLGQHGFQVVAQASDGREATEAVDSHLCDLLILDLALPQLGGVEVIAYARRKNARLRILVLSGYNDVTLVARALHAGANGYLPKHANIEELFRAIASLLEGEEYISPLIDPNGLREATLYDNHLTSREKEVLHLIAEGKTNHHIAQVLSISPHTVTRHRANLMKKLNVHNRVELVSVANQLGLIILPR